MPDDYIITPPRVAHNLTMAERLEREYALRATEPYCGIPNDADIATPQQLETREAPRVAKGYTRRSISEGTRWRVWERDDFRCQHCGSRRFLSVDHIIPVSKGGRNHLDNYQTLCRACNSAKKDRPDPIRSAVR